MSKPSYFYRLVFILFGLLLILQSCSDSASSFKPTLESRNQDEKITNIGRSSWQKPNLVIEKLGDISNKTIADIGAGTGYFTFRMAFKAKKIIATDIDTNMVAIINEFAVNLPLEIQSKIETRLVKGNDPMNKPGECDAIVIINTIAYIKDEKNYLKKLHQVMKPGDTLMIVDFKSTSITGIVSHTQTIDYNRVMKDLKEAGFATSTVDLKTLEYQYIILATA